ncbi:MAG: NAD-dependent deacetylase, partial [Treponema sp.]|nr:NAD-dependent deacetylase [Treponema sp.]
MIEKMFDMIREAKYAVALTGAGASTLSGIPDFRGKDGLYSKVDAEKIFDIEWFKRDPSIYY